MRVNALGQPGTANREKLIGSVMETKRPIHEIRLGNVRATIWPNQKDQRTWYAVSVSRRYKQGSEWKDVTNFNHDDLPVLVQAVQMAYSWIWRQLKTVDSQDEA